jgi:PAS domain-containing protein
VCVKLWELVGDRNLADTSTQASASVLVPNGAFMNEQPKLAERILCHVADAVISTDRSGTINRWNHASTALFGYSAE